MKSQTILSLKLLGLSIIISCITLGLYAQEKYTGLLSSNTETYKIKNLQQKDKRIQHKLAVIDKRAIHEEKQQLEEWMFDSKFWEISPKFEWENEPAEEPREIEEWMKNIKIKRIGCVDIYSDFVEKDWMHEHNFFIL